MKITSVQNPKIKTVQGLRDSKQRRESSLFLIEGARELERALAKDYVCRTLLYCPEIISPAAQAIVNTRDPQQLIEVSRAVFAKLAVREQSDGLLAVMEERHWSLGSLELGPEPLLLVLENLEKPGNYGALARTADGVGVAALLVLDPKADLFNPHAIRASVGALFSLPLVACSHADFAAYCEIHKIRIITASPAAHRFHFEENLQGSLALVLGSEAWGLSSAWQNLTQNPVKIPMRGLADSLNVSVAGAVILYESLRQRS